jgi:uncharacterized membrane protein
VPPSGFTLFVPEEDVIEVDWTVNEVLQVILSGGLTSPSIIPYTSARPTHLIVPEHLIAPQPIEPDASGA